MPFKVEVATVRKATGAAVVVSIPFSACGAAYHDLCSGCVSVSNPSCGSEPGAVDNAIVAYAAFDVVNSLIHGNAAEMLTKDICLYSSMQDGEFVIAARVPQQVAAIKKAIISIVRGLCSCHKTYSKYASLARELGLKPDRDAFDASVHAMNAAINKKVSCVVTGKVNAAKKDIWKKVSETVDAKIETRSGLPSGKKRSAPVPEDKSVPSGTWVALKKTDPVVNVMLARYIESALKIRVLISRELVYYEAKHDTKVKALGDKDRISRFAAPTEKLGDDLMEALVHEGIQCAAISATVAAKALSEKMTPKKLESAMSKAF